MAKSLGSNIVTIREAVGLSQGDVARKSKASLSTLSLIEANKREPSFGMLRRIKRALGCEWSALLRGIE